MRDDRWLKVRCGLFDVDVVQIERPALPALHIGGQSRVEHRGSSTGIDMSTVFSFYDVLRSWIDGLTRGLRQRDASRVETRGRAFTKRHSMLLLGVQQ